MDATDADNAGVTTAVAPTAVPEEQTTASSAPPPVLATTAAPTASDDPLPASVTDAQAAAAPVATGAGSTKEQTPTPTATATPAPAAQPEETLRLVVTGFQKFMNAKEVTKIMKHANIEYDSLKRAMSTPTAVLRFTSVAQRDKAAADLVGVCVKGRPLRSMVPVDEERRIFNNRPGQEQRGGKRGGGGDGGDDRGGKRWKQEDGTDGGKGKDNGWGHVEKVKTLAEVVSPLFHLPYAEQLQQKEKEIAVECVGKMFREIRKSYEFKNKQLKRAHHLGEGASSSDGGARQVRAPSWAWGKEYARDVFVTEPITPSPVLEGYRNKSEFTVGRDAEGRPTVGFRLGTFRDDNMHVGGVEGGCVLLDPLTLRVVAALQAFVRRPGALPVYDQRRHEGVWRYVTVRTSRRTGQCLVWVCAAIEKVGAEAWGREQAAMVELLTAATRPSAGGEEKEGGEGEGGELKQEGASATPTTSSTSDSTTAAAPPSSSSSTAPAWTGITSLFLGPYEGLSNPNANDPLIHLWGSSYMEEELLGLKFRISPHAFFQVNTAGAEVLYQRVIDESWAGGKRRKGKEGGKEEEGGEEGGPKLILDVCCGTGTIGICAATQLEREEGGIKGEGGEGTAAVTPATTTTTSNSSSSSSSSSSNSSKSKQKSLVLGIELCASAVQDAIVNAQRNGVQNAAFVCSKAEDVLLTMLRDRPPSSSSSSSSSTNAAEEARLAGLSSEVRAALRAVMVDSSSSSSSSNLVAIVDPPRNGLHADCLRALRNCRQVQRLVYVSCNPTKSLPRDAVALCGPTSQKLKGRAFRPVKAVPVDMFPHTSHCEVLMVFERDGGEEEEEEGGEEAKEGGGKKKEVEEVEKEGGGGGGGGEAMVVEEGMTTTTSTMMQEGGE